MNQRFKKSLMTILLLASFSIPLTVGHNSNAAPKSKSLIGNLAISWALKAIPKKRSKACKSCNKYKGLKRLGCYILNCK